MAQLTALRRAVHIDIRTDRQSVRNPIEVEKNDVFREGMTPKSNFMGVDGTERNDDFSWRKSLRTQGLNSTCVIAAYGATKHVGIYVGIC